MHKLVMGARPEGLPESIVIDHKDKDKHQGEFALGVGIFQQMDCDISGGNSQSMGSDKEEGEVGGEDFQLHL